MSCGCFLCVATHPLQLRLTAISGEVQKGAAVFFLFGSVPLAYKNPFFFTASSVLKEDKSHSVPFFFVLIVILAYTCPLLQAVQQTNFLKWLEHLFPLSKTTGSL